MPTGVITWSQTAAANGTADAAVNWAEGMAPSAVNDSARAEMASVAKWRDDLNGTLVTTGTSTAYSIISNQGFTALAAGLQVAFAPHVTNGATVTINVDGLGAKPLRTAPNVELQSGTIIHGTPYVATYATTNSGEWILHGYYSSQISVPVGAIFPYGGNSAPSSNYAFPAGQGLNRTTYSTLFSICGVQWGAGDGVTTFNVPDLRGRAPFGVDNMGGSPSARITFAGSGIAGSSPGATGGTENVTLTDANLPSNFFVIPNGASGATAASGSDIPVYPQGQFSNIGTNTPVVKMPPCLIMNWLIRII